MAILRLILRRTLEHRARRLIVIILTLLTTLAGIGLAADKYFDLQREQTALHKHLLEAQSEASRLDNLKVQHASLQDRLSSLETRAVTEDQVDQVRDELMGMLRESKCQFRRMEVSNLRLRSWRKGDHPLDGDGEEAIGIEPGMNGSGSGYDLRTQEIALECSGELPNTRDFVSRVHRMKRMVYVAALQVSPDPTGEDVHVRLSVVLFGLKKSEVSNDEGPALPGLEAPEPPPPPPSSG